MVFVGVSCIPDQYMLCLREINNPFRTPCGIAEHTHTHTQKMLMAWALEGKRLYFLIWTQFPLIFKISPVLSESTAASSRNMACDVIPQGKRAPPCASTKSVCFRHWRAQAVTLNVWQHYGEDPYRQTKYFSSALTWSALFVIVSNQLSLKEKSCTEIFVVFLFAKIS